MPDRCCPDDLAANCHGCPGECWACVWPDESLVPTNYVPINPAAKIPTIAAKRKERAAQRKAAKHSEASKRGKRSVAKGKYGERQAAKLTGGHRQPGSGAYRGNLSNDVVADASLAHQQIESKYGASYPLKTVYEKWLAKWEVVFVVGQQTSFIVTTFDYWELRQWDGLSVGAVTSKEVKTWEDFLLDEAEKPEVVFARWPRKPMVVMQRIPHWIRHMAPEPTVDFEKLMQAKALMEEALS